MKNNAIALLFFCLVILMSCENKLERVTIDCSNLSELLIEIHRLDQDVRKTKELSKIDFDLMKKQDHINLCKVVSIIEQCGMPTSNEIDKHQIETIFLVIQHSKLKYQKRYYPILERSALNGDLEKSSLAKLKDRILVNEGKPQIYGTQLKIDIESNTARLYELEDPESVDKRRQQVGLVPLQDYLNGWNVKFDVKQID